MPPRSDSIVCVAPACRRKHAYLSSLRRRPNGTRQCVICGDVFTLTQKSGLNAKTCSPEHSRLLTTRLSKKAWALRKGSVAERRKDMDRYYKNLEHNRFVRRRSYRKHQAKRREMAKKYYSVEYRIDRLLRGVAQLDGMQQSTSQATNGNCIMITNTEEMRDRIERICEQLEKGEISNSVARTLIFRTHCRA